MWHKETSHFLSLTLQTTSFFTLYSLALHILWAQLCRRLVQKRTHIFTFCLERYNSHFFSMGRLNINSLLTPNSSYSKERTSKKSVSAPKMHLSSGMHAYGGGFNYRPQHAIMYQQRCP